MSHCWTPALDCHFNQSFIVLKHVQHHNGLRKFDVALSMWHNSELSWLVGTLVWFFFRVLNMTQRHRFPCADESLVSLGWFWSQWNTSFAKFQKSKGGIPSIRGPASREIISASVELWETEVCFLHIQLIGTNVWVPKMHKIPPDVDFEPSKSQAKSESWNNPNLHCCAVFPTWQYCLNSLVWWLLGLKRAKRLSPALVHCVMARASLFTDNKISGLPVRDKLQAFENNLSAYFWQFSNRSYFFFCQLMVVNAWSCDFVQLLNWFIR